MLAGLQIEPVHPEGRRRDGLPGGESLEDLDAHPSAAPDGPENDGCLLEVRHDRLDVSRSRDPGSIDELGRRRRADDHEPSAGHGVVHRGEDPLDDAPQRVDVRRMFEAADEQEGRFRSGLVKCQGRHFDSERDDVHGRLLP